MNTLGYYGKELSKIKPLNHDKEEKLFRDYYSKKITYDELKNSLLIGNLRFVVNVAKKYVNENNDLRDLVCEGNIGLIKAIDKFDYTKGVRFFSYAVWWIKENIIKSLHNNSSTIRIPKSAYTNKNIRLSKIDYSEYATHLEETMVSDTYNEINSKMLSNDLYETMDVLEDIEKYVIIKYYGIECEKLNLKEIGDSLENKLTKERVRQIKEKAIKKLRNDINKLKKYL